MFYVYVVKIVGNVNRDVSYLLLLFGRSCSLPKDTVKVGFSTR